MIVNEYTLLPDLPSPMRRFQVAVTLPRAAGDQALHPPGGRAVVELAAAAVVAEGLLTAWTWTQSVLSMIVELPSMADALAAGVAVARVLEGGNGMASVTAVQVAAVRED